MSSGQSNEKQFKGTIRLDVRDSTPDWDPYMPPKAPRGAPNILFVLFDDTGLAAWSPFGGGIRMPTLERIARRGLMYTQWHTAALCSPTRSMLLTGRNHHLNGCASITEGANGFPGQHARIPDACATVAQLLQDNGWSTFWVGKNHNVPATDVGAGSTRSQWPLAKGFDRFYGFLGGETNQWYPDLVEDNHFVELPEGHKPGFTADEEEAGGYHLSKDLADKAIQMIKDQKASHPSKPWYMWFCPGANHAPHQVPQSFIDKYWGDSKETGDDCFDFTRGYDEYRQWVVARMIEKGVLPEGTELSEMNPLEGLTHASGNPVANPDDRVIPWESEELDDDQRRVFAKLMAVYAAYSEYTDYQIGRMIDYLEETGQLDNTVILYAADNGASGEGSPKGSVNENKFFNGYPESDQENARLESEFGGPNTYEHFPTGWAMATSAPFKMFKRYSEYAGGTCDPLVISWPKGIDESHWGGVRDQYHHATDIVPTILDICGLEMPSYYKGVRQYPLSGVSMRYTFEDPEAQTKKYRQYYAMLGTRALWQEGYKAVSLHAPLSSQGGFDKDEWELYHVDSDRAESHPLDVKNDPDNKTKLESLVNAWFEEAGKNMVLPLDDRNATEQLTVERPTEERPRLSYVYYPGAAPIPESLAVNVRGKSFLIQADVELTENSAGVIFAHGSRFGGHSLFIKDSRVYYVYNFLGIEKDSTVLFSDEELLAGDYRLSVSFHRTGIPSNYTPGDFSLHVYHGIVPTKGRVRDAHHLGIKIASMAGRKTQVGNFTLCGDGLCIGYDSADAVASHFYEGSNPFRGGTIHSVRITPGPEEWRISPRVAAGAFSAD